MRHRRRGITLTELLVVVSVITILAAMVAPVLQRAWARAIQASCANNMGRIYQGFQILANQRSGKLPQCFDINYNTDTPDDSTVREGTWWFRKVGDIIYGSGNDENPLRLPTSEFRPERCVMRCPASPDHYDQARTPSAFIPRVEGSGLQRNEKDRVYDNNYGFNNWGFRYSNSDCIPDPRGLGMGHPGTNPLYHGSGAITGYYETPVAPSARADQSYIGHLADVPYADSVILLMDYIKADIAPMGGSSNTDYHDDLFGFRFRHGSSKVTRYDTSSPGQANILFVDGHIAGYSAARFATKYGDAGKSSLTYEVRRRY
jgi:prepilin-type N-terminal cleavage/methylation domain-containing protein/prepilin-type processing-associated H-X9-DG protein